MSTNVLLPSTLLLINIFGLSSPQNINGHGTGGCSFLDDTNVYNIELLRGRHQAPCPSLNSLNDDFKQTGDKISETAYELSRIQTRIVELLDQNNKLTGKVHSVQDELRATMYALKTGDVGRTESFIYF